MSDLISLESLRNLWKKNADWISGLTSDKPAVTIHGSDDGTTKRVVKTDENGKLDVVGTVKVDQTGNGVTIKNSAGTEILTSANPGAVALYGTMAADLLNKGELIKRHNSLLIRNTPPATPFPPRIVPDLLTSAQHGWYLPQWMDKDGVWWGAHPSLGLFKSTDYGATWPKVMNAPDTTSYALIVSDTGRAIWACGNGKVYVSDEAKTTWTLAFTFPAGYTDRLWGHCKYKNIILMGTYGTFSATNPPRYVYASFDNGATWAQIYQGPLLNNYHVHDVAYDPWDDRIWIAEGDGSQSQIVYSDDRGGTWKNVYSVRGIGLQVTSIIPGPFGVLFGSDRAPDGLALWPRPRSPIQATVNSADIIPDYYRVNASDTMQHVFRRPWYNIETPGKLLYVIGAGSESGANGYPRLIVSQDGLNFAEIWRGNKNDGGVQWVVGPDPNDAEQKFMAVTFVGGAQQLLKGKVPVFA